MPEVFADNLSPDIAGRRHAPVLDTAAGSAGDPVHAAGDAVGHVNEATRPVRVLVFTTLYPNSEQPRHGIFVETRVQHLVRTGGATVAVVAPVPWFPSRSERFRSYGRFARVPRLERRADLDVEHPRFPVIPKVGMSIAPLLLAGAMVRVLRRRMRAGQDFDVIDAHFLYPDGVAAALLGRMLGKPVVMTARGSDVNLFTRFAVPRRWILWAVGHAAVTVTVSHALRERLVGLGADAARVETLRNGVDASQFRPVEREETRRRLGLDGFVIASVGNLVPEKGHDVVLRALAELPSARLLIVGEGPERARLAKVADSLGLSSRVVFHGNVPQDALCALYSAADVLVLASKREGWPNVLLEAMACGTPVVASAVGGVPEIVGEGSGGLVVHGHDPASFARAIAAVREGCPQRAAVRAYAEGFDWAPTVRGYLRALRSAARQHGN